MKNSLLLEFHRVLAIIAIAAAMPVARAAVQLDASAVKWSFSSDANTLAILSDGTVFAGTVNRVGLNDFQAYLINPCSGTTTQFVAPGPINVVWTGAGAGDYLLGGYEGRRAVREDSSEVWSWGLIGCCSSLTPAIDLEAETIFFSADRGVHVVNLRDAGRVPSPSSEWCQDWGGFPAVDGTYMYLAGIGGTVTRYGLRSSDFGCKWSRFAGSSGGEVALSYGAIGSDSSFAVATCGQAIFGRTQPGQLVCLNSDGNTKFIANADVVTAPVIGAQNHIFVGAQNYAPLSAPGRVLFFNYDGSVQWEESVKGRVTDLLLGDDGRVYILVADQNAGTGEILAFNQQTGANDLRIAGLHAAVEMILQDGTVFVAGGGAVVAIGLPSGFAFNYDSTAPWPVRQHDNQRTSNRSAVHRRNVACGNRSPIANAGSAQQVSAGDNCQATVMLNGSASTDPDGDALSFSWTGPFGSATGAKPTVALGIGVHSIALTVTDSKGASASAGVVVTVQDTTPPVVHCPADIVVSCSRDALVAVNFAATAQDNCDSSPLIGYSRQPGSGFPVGESIVTCTATDSAGNSSSCQFSVTRKALGFSGFLNPIGGSDSTGGSFTSPLRTFKANSTIPVKFTASCDGSPVLTGVHTLRAVKYTDATTAGDPIDATPQGTADGGNQFRLVDDQWQFNLDTKATGLSIGIWQLVATMSDGSEHQAWIQIK